MTPALTKSVPFFVYSHVFESREEDFRQLFTDIGRRGALMMQRDLGDFERHLGAFLPIARIPLS